MSLWGSISGALGGAASWVTSQVSNVWEGVQDAWSDTGPTAAGPGGGWARRIGTTLGDIGEQVATGLVAQAVPMPGGGRTGAGPIDIGALAGPGYASVPVRSTQQATRQAELDAVTRSTPSQVLTNTGPSSAAGGGFMAQAPIDMPQLSFTGGIPAAQVQGAGMPAIAVGTALGTLAERGLEWLGSETGQAVTQQALDLFRGRTSAPGGAAYAAEGEEAMPSAIQPYQGPGVLPYGGTLFRQTAAGIRPQSIVMVRHPVTMKPIFYRYAGRPLLFSGDFAVARRVDKLARKARRARGGRR